MIEKWKKIKGFKNYKISNFGRVKVLKREIKIISCGKEITRKYKETILKPSTNNCGYKIIMLKSDTGEYEGKLIHRLVAESFIPHKKSLNEVNHIDEDKSNNRVDNLEWCNHKYNMNYGNRGNKLRETMIKNGSMNKTEDMKIINRMMKGVINIFKDVEETVYIYEGKEYGSRIEWCSENNKTLARMCQMISEGKIEIKKYITRQPNCYKKILY